MLLRKSHRPLISVLLAFTVPSVPVWSQELSAQQPPSREVCKKIDAQAQKIKLSPAGRETLRICYEHYDAFDEEEERGIPEVISPEIAQEPS